jgi:hypothetical protein
MTEKTWRLSISRRPQATAAEIAPAEIDFGGVLDRYNPPSDTGSRRSFACRSQNLLRRHMPRSQEPMNRHLPSPIASKLAQNQRASGYNAFKQSRSRLFPTLITEKSDLQPRIVIHPRLLAFASGQSITPAKAAGSVNLPAKDIDIGLKRCRPTESNAQIP